MGSVITILDIIKNLGNIGSDETVHMRKPWDIFSHCIVAEESEDHINIFADKGFVYFLEVFILSDLYDDLKKLNISDIEIGNRIIEYAKNDA